jgi:hypothetical protein
MHFNFNFPIFSSYWCSAGFTDGSEPPFNTVGSYPNSYGIAGYGGHKETFIWLSGKEHELECPTGFIKPGDVFGCGLLLNSKNEFELAVFFTVNGILLGKLLLGHIINDVLKKIYLGKQRPINPTVDRLYPTVSFYEYVEANFGSDLVAKPFKFDTDKCPGLVFE